MKNEVMYIVGAVVVAIFIISGSFFLAYRRSKKKKDIEERKEELKKEIRSARGTLRKIYSKYLDELNDVMLKIDGLLEELEGNGED